MQSISLIQSIPTYPAAERHPQVARCSNHRNVEEEDSSESSLDEDDEVRGGSIKLYNARGRRHESGIADGKKRMRTKATRLFRLDKHNRRIRAEKVMIASDSSAEYSQNKAMTSFWEDKERRRHDGLLFRPLDTRSRSMYWRLMQHKGLRDAVRSAEPVLVSEICRTIQSLRLY